MLNNPLVANSIGNLQTNNSIGGLQKFISNFINLAFGVSGVILIVMLLWGGYEYITAGGDKEATQRAMKRMTSALIGIAILFSIYAIIFAIEVVFGINIREFKVPTVNTP